MVHKVAGVVAGAKGAAVELRDVLVPDPAPGEALVRNLDRFVTEAIPVDGVEKAFHKMERGEVLRSVVVF